MVDWRATFMFHVFAWWMVAKGELDRLSGSNGSLRNLICCSHSAGVKKQGGQEREVGWQKKKKKNAKFS